MSLKEKILSKHVSAGTGALGIKGIKPVGRKAPVCTKTLTKDGLRVRYICPPSGGKQAVRSLENLPFKPEDVPEKIQEVKTFSPEQQYTPKQQREESEKIKEALLKRPHTLHFVDHPEAGPDNVHDHLHLKEPEEAGPDKVQDNLHFKEPKEAKEKKKKKKGEEEEDVSKALFLDSSVYFKKSFQSLNDVRDQLSKGVPGPSMGAPTQTRGEQAAGEKKLRRDMIRQEFLVGKKTSPEDRSPIGKFLANNSNALVNLALMHPGGRAASATGRLTAGGSKAFATLMKKHGAQVVDAASGATLGSSVGEAGRRLVLVAMLSSPLGKQGAQTVKQFIGVPQANVKVVKTAMGNFANKGGNITIGGAKKVAEQTAKPATKLPGEVVAEGAKKLAGSPSAAATGAVASVAAERATRSAPAEAPAASPSKEQSSTEVPTESASRDEQEMQAQRRIQPQQQQQQRTAEKAPERPSSKPSGKSKRLPYSASSDEPEKRRLASGPSKRAGSAVKRSKDKQRAIEAALSSAVKQHGEAEARGQSYSKMGRKKEIEEISERHAAASKRPSRPKRARTSDLFSSLSAFPSRQSLSKSAAFVAPYARQVMHKKMSLTAALDKVPWWMQDELLEYLRSKKKKG